jgi:DNA-binding Lrp family transcriptional regulator
MSRKIDLQEKKLIRELVLNPRISDNQISKNTGIPLKTVNRKRKKLEKDNLISYMTYLDTSDNGTSDFKSRQMYIITFSHGITRSLFLDKIRYANSPNDYLIKKHVLESQLGETDGKLCLIIILESRLDTDILEIFNAEIIPFLHSHLGHHSIKDVQTINLTYMGITLHNYTLNKENISLFGQLNKDTVYVADNIK